VTTGLRSELARGSLGLALLVASTWLVGGAPWLEAEPEAIGTRGASPSDPALPPASSRPEAEVVDYRLEVRLEGEILRGRGTVLLRNVSSVALDELWMHLYLNAFEGPETVYGRVPPLGFRGAKSEDTGSIELESLRVEAWDAELSPEPAHTPGEPLDRTDLRFPLPRSLPPGQSLELEMRFTSKLPPVTMRTGHAGDFVFAGQWFPKLAKLEPDGRFAHFPFERFSEFYADFGRYEVSIDVPEHYVVGATGKKVESRAAEGRKVERYVQDGVHDFAFSAWPHFVEQQRVHRGVSIRSLHPPGHEANGARALEVAAFGLDHYGERYGDYPYETLTIVHPPEGAEEAGGMEYPTLITTGGPFWASHSPGRDFDGLVLHELGHQWFYGIVATDEHAWPFLDEGLTTFVTGRALEALHPGAPILSGTELGVGAWDRASGRRARHRQAVASSAGSYATGSDYASSVYSRAATLLRSIDGAYDGAATRAVELYARRHRFGHPTPRELLEAVRETGGDEASEALRLGLFERAHVDYEVVAVSSRAIDDGHEVEALLRRSGSLALPVEVELTLRDGQRLRETWDARAPFLRLRRRTSAPLLRAHVDPDSKLPVDDDRTNDARSLTPSSFAPRAFSSGLVAARWLAEVVAP
jgi:hypothetical protein